MNHFAILNPIMPFLGALIGIGFGLVMQTKKESGVKLLLAFSGAFLLGILLLHILPEIFNAPDFGAGTWILAGVIIQLLMEYLSHGVEHGHAHTRVKYRYLPLMAWISLCLHAFLEGLPLQDQNTLIWGVFVHKIPVAIVLVFLMLPKKNKPIVFYGSLFLFTTMTPLGSIIALNLLDWENIQYPITALVAGMLLHIATTILFESNQGHQFNLKKIFIILVAIVLTYVLE